MTYFRSIAIAALAVFAVANARQVQAQTPKELAQTARYVAAFQNPDGGFAGAVGGKSSLGGTSSGLKNLKYTAGTVPDVLKCIAFVESCFNKETGGFSQTPGGKTDVATTSIGLMCVGELKIDSKPFAKALEYLAENAKSFEEVRIAVAGFEAINAKSPVFEKWTAIVNEGRNADGTWGNDVTKGKDTGGHTAALLRMGVKLDHREAIVAALRATQQADGGWSADGKKSDLGTSYRVMRSFYMMKERPDLERLRNWLGSLRQSDGGYASTPGGVPDMSTTYSCTIMLYWARLLEGEPATVETIGFVPLFDGKSLEGWEGDTKLWAAKDGKIVGTSTGMKNNNFLATKASYGDFIFKCTFRVRGDDSANSGVQFRSVRVPGHEMSGYQADIGQGYWGCLYDESRRNKILVQGSPKAVESIRKNDWNTYMIRAMGDKITLTLNGVTSVMYTEPDAAIARDGKIALQIHAGNALTVEFKDIYIQPMPIPTADKTGHGFHLKTVEGPDGTRKYGLYLPRDYDAKKTYPVVMFLHGSGERGSDGITSSQVGMGTSLLANPDDFPGIAIFPQAKQGWAANSNDAKAALAALDDVIKNYKVDKDRIALTGISMGGFGTWEIGTANADRFSAMAAVCGRGKPEMASSLKGMPVWVVCGDEDGIATVNNSRTMAKALKDAGGNVKYTEYRAVGHNSWDRAYNDLVLLDWLLTQSRRGRTTKGD